MNKITSSDILRAAARKDLSSEAKAAQLLFDAEKIFTKILTQESIFVWKIHSWKKGVLICSVEHPAGAQILYHHSENVLSLLRNKYPSYRITNIRIRIQENEDIGLPLAFFGKKFVEYSGEKEG